MGIFTKTEFQKITEGLDKIYIQLRGIESEIEQHEQTPEPTPISDEQKKKTDEEERQAEEEKKVEALVERYDVWMRKMENAVFLFIIISAVIAFTVEMASMVLYLAREVANYLLQLAQLPGPTTFSLENSRGIMQSLMLLFIFAEIITVARLYILDNMRKIPIEKKSYRMAQGAMTILLVTIVRQIILLDENKIESDTVQVMFFSVILALCIGSVYFGRFMNKNGDNKK